MKNKMIPVLVSFILLFAIILVTISVSEVEVTGNRYYTAEQVEELVFPTRVSRNCMVCFVREMLGKKQDIPFVQDYKISFTSPTSVEIILYEKSLVGYVSYMSSYMYFDKDGIVVESANRGIPGIPEVTGLRFGSIVLYKPLPVESEKIFSMILNLTQALSSNEIPVDRIRYDRDLNATLQIGGISVQLGSTQEMNGKLTQLKNLLPEIRDKHGTVDLSGYDPTVSRPRFSLRETP